MTSINLDDIFDRNGNISNDEGEKNGKYNKQKRQLANLVFNDDDVDESDQIRNNEAIDLNDNATQEENDEIISKLRDQAKESSKTRVVRPQPKLDVARLKSSRGLASLETQFEKVKFKGRGHEAEDLNLLMSHLEHWAHRLIPKMPFTEVVERLEKLGAKKEIQTCIKRIRLDLPVLDRDVINNNEDENENYDDPFDNMDSLKNNSFDKENTLNFSENIGDKIDDKINENNVNLDSNIKTYSSQLTPSSNPINKETNDLVSNNNNSATQTLTPNQRERLETNRLMALKRRAEKLGVSMTQNT